MDATLDDTAAWTLGRQEGRQAGLEAGYRQGHVFGKRTALEHGLELGFMRGVLQVFSETNPNNDERIQHTMIELESMLHEYLEHTRESGTAASSETTDNNNNNNVEQRFAQELIDRIQAKFKLLMVQVGFPHFSLQKVMQQEEEEEEMNASSNVPSSVEW